MRNNIQVRAVHIEGKLNEIADYISFADGSFPTIGSQGIFNSFRHSGGVLLHHFKHEIDVLLDNSVAPSTARQYEVALNQFRGFRLQFDIEEAWPAPLQDIMVFIAHMYRNGLSHSTVNCYISGLSFYSQINNFEDFTQMFLVRKMIEGMKRTRSKCDTRLSITKEWLRNIMSIL